MNEKQRCLLLLMRRKCLLLKLLMLLKCKRIIKETIKARKKRLSRRRQPKPERMRGVFLKPPDTRKRRLWVRESLKRDENGENEIKIKASKHDNTANINNNNNNINNDYYRISQERFQHLCDLLCPRLQKQTLTRDPISVKQQLAMTMRYLTSGMAIQDIAMAFGTGLSTASNVIHKANGILWSTLQPLYMPNASEADFETIANDFYARYQFPNCVGAVGARHVQTQISSSGTATKNQKGRSSTVVTAVVDSRCRFVSVDVQSMHGAQSSANIFAGSTIGSALKAGTLPLPGLRALPDSDVVWPHLFIGDETCEQQDNLVVPFAGSMITDEQQIFNDHLNRARGCVDNVFGVLSARWRVLRRPINVKPENLFKIIRAVCVLHNYLCAEEEKDPCVTYCPSNFVDTEDECGNAVPGEWRALVTSAVASEVALKPIAQSIVPDQYGGGGGATENDQLREGLARYFISHISHAVRNPWHWILHDI